MKTIAFIGSPSSGKTTLINKYIATHPDKNVHAIRGVTRAIVNRGFPLGMNAVVDSYANYIRDQLRAEKLARTSTCDLIFSDRTVMDAAAYARVNARLPRPYIPEYFVEMLLEVALLEASDFDMFVLCPVEFPMVEDDFRPKDEIYRREVGEEMASLLVESRIPHIVVSGSVASRLEQLNTILEDPHG